MLVWSIHGYKRQGQRHQHPGLCCGCSGSGWSCAHSTNVPPSWRASRLKRRTPEFNILQFSVANVLRHTPCLTGDIFLTVNKHDVQPNVEFSNTVFKDLFHCLYETKQRLPFFGGRAAIIHSQGSGKNTGGISRYMPWIPSPPCPGVPLIRKTPNCTGSTLRYSLVFPNATWKNI